MLVIVLTDTFKYIYLQLRQLYTFTQSTMKSKSKLQKSKTKIVNSQKQTETKFVDTINNAYVTTSTGGVFPLNKIAQGIGYSERIGNDVRIKQLECKLYLAQIFTGGVILSNTRIIIFQDLQQVDSSTPTVLDVIFPTTPTSLRNYPNRRRFKILSEMIVPLDVYKPHKVINFNLPVTCTTRFSTPLNLSLNKNGLYLLIISDGGIISAPVLDYSIRCKYTDD
jgi:hypothetical protein